MHGDNLFHAKALIYTDHASQRIRERGISQRDIEIVKKYGTESEDCIDHKIWVDYDACQCAVEDGLDITNQFALTIIVATDGVLKTAYYRSDSTDF
jgi:hypothetical protein